MLIWFLHTFSTQDFLIYLLVGPETVIGQGGDPEHHSKADILLFATDILQRHCCFHRRHDNSLTVLCPCQGAVVTRNGKVLREEVQLSPGDVIGLGQRYLFLFKDPVALKYKVRHCILEMNGDHSYIICQMSFLMKPKLVF